MIILLLIYYWAIERGSISRVRVGRGSMASGQGQQLKSALLPALNAQKREVITDGPTDIVTYRVACTRLKMEIAVALFLFIRALGRHFI